MRHKISGNRLSCNSSLRKAKVRDIAKATLVQERICTTKAKAKEARKLVDRLITLGKKGTLADKRRAFAILCDHKLVSTLFKETSPRFKNRIGGYTRIIPLGTRRGDNAQLALLELTEKREIIVSKPKSGAAIKKEEVSVKTSKVAPKEQVSKKDSVKAQPKNAIAQKEKPNNKFFGGIRKMFDKKSSGK